MDKAKKIIALITLIMMPGLTLQAEKLGRLEGILTPHGLACRGNELFILQDASIHVYSLPGLQKIREFGRKGQGPGELEVTSWLKNTLILHPDGLVVNSVNKVIVFDFEGTVKRELRRSEDFTQMVPVGSQFVAKQRIQTEKEQFTVIRLFFSETGVTKELSRQPFPAQRGELQMLPDAVHYQVYEHKIFIEDSPRGFLIEVFNPDGTPLYSIDKEFKSVKLTGSDRRLREESAKTDPFIRMQEGGWDRVKKEIKLVYPEYYPPIRDFMVNNNKIYVQTFNSRDENDEFIILDLDGRELQSCYLPAARKPSFTEEMMGTGVRYWTIDQGQYFYIVETEEACELHRREIE